MRLGIDLGGTKIAAVVLAGDGRVVVGAARRRRRATTTTRRSRRSPSLVAAGERAAGERCTVGIGIPGAISPATGLVKNANSTWLNGRPLHAGSRAAPRRGPCASPMTRTAWRCPRRADGAAAGARVVFGVILGTGTGGGVVVARRGRHGRQRDRGEWGHNPLPWPDDDERPGPACYCGRHGCIETFLSGPGLAADYARRGGEPCRSEEIVARADRGEALALTALDVWERRLARALATVINVLDPDVIVVGGGLSRSRAALRRRAAALGAVGLLGRRRDDGWCRRSTATPAASAARRGSGAGAGRRLRVPVDPLTSCELSVVLL